MKISDHIAIASLLLPLLGADLSSQSSGGRAVQARVTSSRPSVRGVRGFNSRPKSWLLTRPSKKPSPNPTTNPSGGTNQDKKMTQRVTTRLPKRLFSFGPWMPNQRPLPWGGWCGTPQMPQQGQQNGWPPGVVGMPAPTPNR
jgi:hypothetical protein